MKITLAHLKTRWDNDRIKAIKKTKTLIIGSEKVISSETNIYISHVISTIWSKNHDRAVRKRNEHKYFKHVFISQICDVAVEEYKTVCEFFGIKKIMLVGDKRFINQSKKMLKPLNKEMVGFCCNFVLTRK
jgi:hypothetical protein